MDVAPYYTLWCSVLARMLAAELLNGALADLPSHVASHDEL